MKKMKILGLVAVAALFMYGCAAKVGTTNSSVGNDSSSTTQTETPAPAKQKAPAKEEAYSPVGSWDYTVETPDGASSGTMKITGSAGSYEAVLETDQFGTLEIQDLEIIGTSMTGTIDVGGNTAELEGDFDGDDFSGAVIMGDDVLPIEGTRTSKG